jgi:hypothetical protein
MVDPKYDWDEGKPYIPKVVHVSEEEMNLIRIVDLTDGEFTLEENYQLALESIFRWTLRRDEFSDAQLIKYIKKVAMVALGDI